MDLNENEDRIQRLLDQVKMALQQQEYDRAIAAGQAILNERADHSEALALLQQVRRCQYEQQVQQGERQAQQQAQQALDQVQTLLIRGQWQAALQVADTVPHLEPWSSKAEVLRQRAQKSLAAQLQKEQAQQALQEAERLFGNEDLEGALAQVQKVPEGLECSARAIALQTAIEQAQVLKREYGLACEAFEQRAFDKVRERVLLLLHEVSWQARARALLDKATTQQQQDEQALALLPRLRTLAARGQWKAAIIEANALLALFPGQPEVLRVLQQAQEKLEAPSDRNQRAEGAVAKDLVEPDSDEPGSDKVSQRSPSETLLRPEVSPIRPLLEPGLREERLRLPPRYIGLALAGVSVLVGASLLLLTRKPSVPAPSATPPGSSAQPSPPLVSLAVANQGCTVGELDLSSLRPEVSQERRAILEQAQRLAAVDTPTALKQAIEKASCVQQVPDRDGLYRDAEKLTAEWSNRLWQRADTSVKRDDLGKAITTLQQLPPNSPRYVEAQTLLRTWRSALQQRQIDYRHIQTAQARLAANPSDPNTLLAVAAYLNRTVPEGRPHYPVARQLIERIAQQLWFISQGLQDQGKVADAIRLAKQIPLDTAARTVAQNTQIQWQQLLTAATPSFSPPPQPERSPERRLARSKAQPNQTPSRPPQPLPLDQNQDPVLALLPNLNEDQVSMNQARSLAKQDDPYALRAAVEKASKVSNGPYRREAQALISQWSLNMWRLAHQEYRAGNRRKAVDILRLIPNNTTVWQRHARNDYQRWKREFE
ncbi:lipopolysaccharide assembly protein LapB [Leptolyngbya sp. FACHB-261]|uniref:tetratricopeptide repeat protein n=1 Tax=Leptolyngbya sp. FACHB-261 TaxID=2692806 RepID=UPI001682CAFB|nr:hypothetical protein [Leptolyngbya sp. FACHB-261]MBD2102246.1 hypothetical protein [Leptolyngbya sp. FACHB-261]